MKKTTYILLAFAYIITGCHSSPTPGNSNSNKLPTDTAKMQVNQPAADTSVKDGWLVTHYPNGVIKERSYYVAGRRQGECQYFYSNGKLWSDDYFAAGLRDGATVTYYDNGQKRYEGSFAKGKPAGTWNFYDGRGKLTGTKVFGKNQANPAM